MSHVTEVHQFAAYVYGRKDKTALSNIRKVLIYTTNASDTCDVVSCVLHSKAVVARLPLRKLGCLVLCTGQTVYIYLVAIAGERGQYALGSFGGTRSNADSVFR